MLMGECEVVRLFQSDVSYGIWITQVERHIGSYMNSRKFRVLHNQLLFRKQRRVVPKKNKSNVIPSLPILLITARHGYQDDATSPYPTFYSYTSPSPLLPWYITMTIPLLRRLHRHLRQRED